MGQDLICFSHLRWNFVYQRPQHLLARFALGSRVFFIEEPIFENNISAPSLSIGYMEDCNVHVIVPHLPAGMTADQMLESQRHLIALLIEDENIEDYIVWYYSPMAFLFSNHLNPALVIFDCMDELSAFKNAPPDLIEVEKSLFNRADIVFTGGQSLYKAKKHRHKNIYAMPSAINKNDFYPARANKQVPADQASIPHPRLGFYGVIDERFDTVLVNNLAHLRPDFHLVFIGPVVKIDPATLPDMPNIHYLGAKQYNELPDYISGWDLCIMPFAINESTRYISPTKTPEFLASGKPVISTPITDVVDPYGNNGLIYIRNDAEGFAEAAGTELSVKNKTEWLGRVDNFLSGISWDKTFEKMVFLMEQALLEKKIKQTIKTDSYV